MKSILILDDDRRIREELSEFLIRTKFQVFSAEKPTSAFQLLALKNIDILLLDFSLPEMNGLEVLKIIRKSYPDLKVILMSGNINENDVNEARRYGAEFYLAKPFLHIDVKQVLNKII